MHYHQHYHDDDDQVAQWSDLVVFDFLTGNYDRVSSMQVNIIIIIIIIIIIGPGRPSAGWA